MKKMIAVFVLACAFTAASANDRASIDAKTSAFVQPFSVSYMLDTPYLWFTDIDPHEPNRVIL